MSDTSALSVISLDYSAVLDGVVYFKSLLAVALMTSDCCCMLALVAAEQSCRLSCRIEVSSGG